MLKDNIGAPAFSPSCLSNFLRSHLQILLSPCLRGGCSSVSWSFDLFQLQLPLPSRWERSTKPPQGMAVPLLRTKSQSASRNEQAEQTRSFNPSRCARPAFAAIAGFSWESFLPFVMRLVDHDETLACKLFVPARLVVLAEVYASVVSSFALFRSMGIL